MLLTPQPSTAVHAYAYHIAVRDDSVHTVRNSLRLVMSRQTQIVKELREVISTRWAYVQMQPYWGLL